MKKYTIEEIKNYLLSQDSMGDILYNLNEKNIDKANRQQCDSIELLNSEGPILILKRVEANIETDYIIYDNEDNILDVLDQDGIQDFIHGNITITDYNNKEISYSQYPVSMKPDLKELDEFIGIDTTDKSY